MYVDINVPILISCGKYKSGQTTPETTSVTSVGYFIRGNKNKNLRMIIQVDQYNVKRHKKLQSCTFFLLNELTMKGEVGQRDTIKEAITNKSFLN